VTGPSSAKGGASRGVLVLVAVLALAAGSWLGLSLLGNGRGPTPPLDEVRAATLLPLPKPLSPADLTDQDGEPFRLDRLAGRWTFLSFGYTSCPDVCPMTMATFVALRRELSQKGKDPHTAFLFVSVDPERDTPQRIAQYVRWFDPSFLGATGDHRELQALTGQLGVLYARSEQRDSALGYLVDHTASILLLDPKGRLSAIFSAPHNVTAMAADFETIQSYFRN